MHVALSVGVAVIYLAQPYHVFIHHAERSSPGDTDLVVGDFGEGDSADRSRTCNEKGKGCKVLVVS